jgi:hypothetical protein
MPFKSKAQMKAAFGGYLGPEMKSKAEGWAKETPNIKSLPEHAGVKTGVKSAGLKFKKTSSNGRRKGT